MSAVSLGQQRLALAINSGGKLGSGDEDIRRLFNSSASDSITSVILRAAAVDICAAASKAVDLCCSRNPQTAAKAAAAAALAHPPLAQLMMEHVYERALQLRELGSGLAILMAAMWTYLVVGCCQSSNMRNGAVGTCGMFRFLTMLLRDAEKKDCPNRC
jgi:hypothetical protein